MRLFFSSFLFDGVGHVLRLYHQDSIPTWLFTRLKNNGLVFFFFSHLIFIIDLSSSNSYKDTTITFCVARRRKKKLLEPGWSPPTHRHTQRYSKYCCTSGVTASEQCDCRVGPTKPLVDRPWNSAHP